MKTPLATFTGYVQLLVKQGGHDDQERQALAALDRQTRRLARLVQTLLDADRIQSGEWSMKPSRVDLCGLVQEAIETFQRSQRVPAHLTIDCEAAAIVEVDRLQVLEVIHNLLDNAARYSLGTSPIEVTIKSADDEAVVSVQDHGPGISPEDQRRLFEPWYQTAPMVRPTVGMGLGLYISREIVLRHGGRIWVASDLEMGSTFYFALPLA
jgi:signal transduction histidine kinase